MKNNLLISNHYKVIGWLTFIIFAALGLAVMYLEFKIPGFQVYWPAKQGMLDLNDYNLTNELVLIGVIVGLLMVSFAAEKNEDEYIAHLRLKSWQWSVLVSYAIIIVMTLLTYGLTFFQVMVFNLFTVLIVFIVKFNYSLYCLRKEELTNEK